MQLKINETDSSKHKTELEMNYMSKFEKFILKTKLYSCIIDIIAIIKSYSHSDINLRILNYIKTLENMIKNENYDQSTIFEISNSVNNILQGGNINGNYFSRK